MYVFLAGRISVMQQRGSVSKWLLVEHRRVEVAEVSDVIAGYTSGTSLELSDQKQSRSAEDALTLRFEPFILAVECDSLQHAGLFVSISLPHMFVWRRSRASSSLLRISRKWDRPWFPFSC